MFSFKARFLVLAVACAISASQSLAANPIQIENATPGDANWALTNPALHREIEGYASLTSVNRGSTINLFVSVGNPGLDPQYTVEVYRMGYYNGLGGRRMYGPVTLNSVQQPMPHIDSQFGTFNCDWTASLTLSVSAGPNPTGWVSGVYLAKLTTVPRGYQSYIIFVVRDDARPSDYLFPLSVLTYQAYNNWPGVRNDNLRDPDCANLSDPYSDYLGKSLYNFNSSCYKGYGPPRAAIKVSFNRPYALRGNVKIPGVDETAQYGVGAGEFLTKVAEQDFTAARGEDYSMVRFLEANGLDVSYATSIDMHNIGADLGQNGSTLLRHKAILSVGHDEYWTFAMRDAFEYAKDNGVNLGFFSANSAYFQVRLEPDASNNADRIEVAYRGWPDYRIDPAQCTDGNACPPYSDPHFSDQLATLPFRHPYVNRPEVNLLGVRFIDGAKYRDTDTTDGCTGVSTGAPLFSDDWVLSDSSNWVVNGTANWSTNNDGNKIIGKVVGYEVDTMPTARLPRQVLIAHSPVPSSASCQGGFIYSDTSFYTADTGTGVFAVGAIQWSWALDDYTPPSSLPSGVSVPVDPSAQKVTLNVLERFRDTSHTDIFVRASDNAIWQATLKEGAWQNWQSLGGGFNSGPAVASSNPHQLTVVAVGLDNGLWLTDWSGSGWSPWNGWLGKPAGLNLTSSPAAISTSGGRMDIFVRAADNAIWQLSSTPLGWGSWHSLGGGFHSGPAVASSSPNSLSVFAIGLDDTLWYSNFSGSSWSSWAGLGAPSGLTLTSSPTVVSWDTGRMDLFVRASDNAMWQRSYVDGSWQSWHSLGGGFNQGPAVSSWAVNKLSVFGVGLDNAVWHEDFSSGSWSEWAGLGLPAGLTLTSAPAAVSWYGGK